MLGRRIIYEKNVYIHLLIMAQLDRTRVRMAALDGGRRVKQIYNGYLVQYIAV